MSRRARLADECGMVTAEAAVIMPAIVMLLLLVLSGIAAGVAQLQVTDAARVGARAAAAGVSDPLAVARQAARSVSVSLETGELTCVRAVKKVPGPLGILGAQVDSRACAWKEPGSLAGVLP